MASQEDILKESQIRTTEHVEAHFSTETFNDAQEGLRAWKADMPIEAQDFMTYEGAKAIQV